MNSWKISLTVALLFPVTLFASENYKCNVKQAESLENDGTLKQTSFSKILNNQEFVVERSTGKIIGGKGFSNHNDEFGQPKVLDNGSSEQSYKAITIYKPNVSVSYLQIMEYAKENKKPFIFTTGSHVLTGLCVHY